MSIRGEREKIGTLNNNEMNPSNAKETWANYFRAISYGLAKCLMNLATYNAYSDKILKKRLYTGYNPEQELTTEIQN